MSSKAKVDYSLYLVTNRDIFDNIDLSKTIPAAIRAGVSLVQLREKKATSKEFYRLAMEIKDITRQYNIPLIINDRLDIALAVDADGLHIGDDDLPIAVARELLGENKILGVSAATLPEALAAQKAGADYLGVGAIFPTQSKKSTDKVSLMELQEIKKNLQIPVVAIGGINETNLTKVMSTGVDGVAVISAILGEPDITTATKNLLALINRARGQRSKIPFT